MSPTRPCTRRTASMEALARAPPKGSNPVTSALMSLPVVDQLQSLGPWASQQLLHQDRALLVARRAPGGVELERSGDQIAVGMVQAQVLAFTALGAAYPDHEDSDVAAAILPGRARPRSGAIVEGGNGPAGQRRMAVRLNVRSQGRAAFEAPERQRLAQAERRRPVAERIGGDDDGGACELCLARSEVGLRWRRRRGRRDRKQDRRQAREQERTLQEFPRT